jgi:hypothetical protein
MIIGVLPNAAAAETLLNNLAEAEFNLADVSVLMRDVTQRAAIAEDAGPLRGTDWRELPQRLIEAGLTHSEAQRYMKAVEHGQVVVAIAAPRKIEPIAREMLQDHDAQLIQGVN